VPAAKGKTRTRFKTVTRDVAAQQFDVSRRRIERDTSIPHAPPTSNEVAEVRATSIIVPPRRGVGDAAVNGSS
jgi:hypothetical protein